MKKTIMVLLGCGALLAAGCGGKEKNPVDTSGDVVSIKVMSMPGGEGVVVGDMKIVKDDTLSLYAAGFNEDGEYVKDVIATWTIANTEASIGTIVDSIGSVAMLAATSFGKGTVTASTDDGETDATGTLWSVPGAPDALVSTMGDNAVSISWTPSTSSGFTGYFVYIVKDASPADSTTPATTDTVMDLTTLVDGQPYYVYVRAYQTITPTQPPYLSESSPVVHVATRPYFNVADTLYGYANPGATDVNAAYGWADDGSGTAFALTAGVVDTVDFFLQYFSGDLYMVSPHRHGLGWSSTVQTSFYDMDSLAFGEVREAPAYPDSNWTTDQPLSAGHVYAVRTEDGNYVKLRVTELNTAAATPYILFEYGYQTAAGVTLFKK